MKQLTYLYQNQGHKWAMLHSDPDRNDNLIDTNEYLIIKDDEILITDPGGMEIFPSVFTVISREYNPENIHSIFASHQDPDIISSYPLWLSINPSIKVHISALWSRFITHFGGSMQNIYSIPDEGCSIDFNGLNLQVIPAHYLHSAGNFHLYDPAARILFSGDIGTALGNPQKGIFVKDFNQHITYAEGFHRRYLASEKARQSWCERIADLEIDMMVPQHGAIYKGEDIRKFIHWFSDLELGSAC